MDAPTEKDYIDAKLQAVIERLNGEAKAHQIATDARLDKLNQTIDAGLKSVREESSTKYAQLEASFHRGQSEVIKWVVGAILASTAVSVSTIAVLLVHSAPKPPATAPAPIVIYPQPTPPTPPAR
jgi:hypothetical protein